MSVLLTLSWQALALLALTLIFGFLNGLHDSSNIVATMIASHAMRPRTALWVTAIANAAGPFLFGVAVATTIGHEVVASEAITLPVIGSALLAAVLWNILTWQLGIPSSSSHTLIGGIVGAAVVANGINAILVDGLLKVLIALFVSPPLGLLAGYLIMKLILFIGNNFAFSPKVNHWFRRGQWFTAIWLAASHGANDGQKTMGVATMILVAAGAIASFAVPLWVIGLSAVAIAAGTVFGGWSLIRTLGGGFFKIRPVHSFSTQIASASVILGAALLGGPVSTTQVVGSAIMGVGSAERVSKVRWGLTERIVSAWLLTIPISAIIGGLVYRFVVSMVP